MLFESEIDIKWSKNFASLKMAEIGMAEIVIKLKHQLNVHCSMKSNPTALPLSRLHQTLPSVPKFPEHFRHTEDEMQQQNYIELDGIR